MSGIAALAAAAAATSKMNTPGSISQAGIPGIKVVTPSIMTQSGIKVTPVPGRQRSKSLFTEDSQNPLVSYNNHLM